jgi:hypothetical protein
MPDMHPNGGSFTIPETSCILTRCLRTETS